MSLAQKCLPVKLADCAMVSHLYLVFYELFITLMLRFCRDQLRKLPPFKLLCVASLMSGT